MFALRLSSPHIWKIIKTVKSENLTYLSNAELISLARNVQKVVNNNVQGIIIEAGCALGGSALTIAAAKPDVRLFKVFDTFEMIPPPSINDGEDAHQRYNVIASHSAVGIDSTQYYGYIDNLYERVHKSFVDLGFTPEYKNISLVKGLFEDTMIIDTPIALAHLDCDWYDSVMFCLQRIEPHLSVGGVIIVDDYFHWSGCKKAVDEYFSGMLSRKYSFKICSHLIITRVE